MALRSPGTRPLLCVALASLLGVPVACGSSSSDSNGSGGSAGAGAASGGGGRAGGGGTTSSSGAGGTAHGGGTARNGTAGSDSTGDAGESGASGAGAVGGAASVGGAGGSGTGGSGGAPATSHTCLDPVSYSNVFSITDAAFCAVAVYDADETLGRYRPSWGKHGGPLTARPDTTGGGVTFVRWAPPAAATGALTKQETHVANLLPDATMVLGAQAVDLPFFGWTGIAWWDPATLKGEIVGTKGPSVAQRFALHNPGDFGGVADGDNGRLLYLALSALGNPLGNVNGLFQADACSLPTPALGTGTGCAVPGPVAAWGDSGIALAIDHDGNVFAITQSIGLGTQEARGYAAPLVKRGAPATAGATLFKMPGFGLSLAALTPHGATPGTLVFQPFSGTTFEALDVVEQRYTVAGSVVPSTATPQPLLALKSTNTTLKFMADDQDRLWIAVFVAGGTKFIVLERKAP